MSHLPASSSSVLHFSRFSCLLPSSFSSFFLSAIDTSCLKLYRNLIGSPLGVKPQILGSPLQNKEEGHSETLDYGVFFLNNSGKKICIRPRALLLLCYFILKLPVPAWFFVSVQKIYWPFSLWCLLRGLRSFVHLILWFSHLRSFCGR